MPFRVLVVDDSTFVRDTIKRTLRKFIPSVEIFDAVDGQRAISHMKGNKIDLILSDWEMPEMTGEEFLQWVRSQPSSLKTPFIMISTCGNREHVITAAQAGVSDYLTKPFSPDELKNKVTKQLQKIGYKPSNNNKKTPTISSGFPSLDVNANTPQETTSFEGKAQLRFSTSVIECIYHDLSLQAMNGIIVRPPTMPALFDPITIDMENDRGEVVTCLNAYVHSLQAAELHPNTQKVKFTARFVDNDTDKFEIISKMIARSR